MASVCIDKVSNSESIFKWHALFMIQEWFHIIRKEKDQLPYFLQVNLGISGAIKKCGHKNMDTLGQKMMYLYIHDTLIPQILEEIDQ